MKGGGGGLGAEEETEDPQEGDQATSLYCRQSIFLDQKIFTLWLPRILQYGAHTIHRGNHGRKYARMLTVVERSRGIFFSPFLYTLLFYMEQMIRTMTWKAGKQEENPGVLTSQRAGSGGSPHTLTPCSV